MIDVVEEQMALMPITRPLPVRQELSVDLLHGGGKPSVELRKSIASMGVIQPLIVTVSGGVFTVQDGLRRLSAAREAGMGTVPAQVYREEEWEPGILTIVANMIRSENITGEASVIARLIQAGYTPQEISRELHIPIQKIKARLPYIDLPAAILMAVDEGAVKPGVAKQIARLGKVLQAELVDLLVEKKSITGADVHDARCVRQREVVNSLDLEVDDWRLMASAQLKSTLPLIPEGEEAHRLVLEALINMGQ